MTNPNTVTIVRMDHVVADALYRIIEVERETLSEWLPWISDVRDQSTWAMLLLTWQRMEELLGTQEVYAVKSDSQVVGMITVQHIDAQNRSCALGYWLSQRATGQGVMSKAVQQVVHWLFATRAFHRIELRIRMNNTRSNRLAERLGFRLESISRESEFVQGEFHHQNVYRMLRYEYG
ncbi:MAG: GNAT family N-acetyltransferase [Bacilli bacterium]